MNSPGLTVDVSAETSSASRLTELTVSSLPDSPAPLHLLSASPHVRSIFESAIESPRSSLSSPVSETNDVVALRRELKECENRLQQAGRLGLELHLQNDRLRRGIDHLQMELNGVHENNGVSGEQSEKMPFFSTFSGSNGRLKAMENIKSTNALLQARNMSLNTHCEEADQRIEELMEQVQQLEKVLRKERMARKKLKESETAREQQEREREEEMSSSSSSLTSSPRAAASPRSSSPRAPLRLEYLSSPRGTTHEQPPVAARTITTADTSTMTLEERVTSFLQPPPSPSPPLTPSSSPTALATQLLLSSSVATATTPSLWGPSSSPLSSPVNVALGIDTTTNHHADEMRAAVMVDMHEDVLTLQCQLDVMEEEIIRERSLRDKLEHEVKVYHVESQRWSDEAGILSQRMRVAESARQSAETRARKIAVELRNMVLESDERRDKLQRKIVSEYQEKLSAVEEEKNVAVDRANSFQHQAVQTLKKLMEMHQKQEEEKVKAQSSAADMQQHEHVRRVESAARARGSTRMVPTAEPPTDHGYSLKLKKLEQMYERAGAGGDDGGGD